MHYVIYGAGAIGSVLGGHLAAAGRRVTLVARPAHVEVIRRRGLSVRGRSSLEGVEIEAVEDFADVSLGDDAVVCLTMKTDDTSTALDVALDVAGTRLGTVPLVCFQNGVHNERIVTERGLRGYGGLVFCGATFLETGVAVRTAGGHFAVGTLPTGVDGLCERMAADITGAGLDGSANPDIMASKWGKLLRNLNNALLAVADLSVAEALADEATRTMQADVMQEGVDALRAAGVAYEVVGEGDSVEAQIAGLRQPGTGPRFSMPADDEIRPSTWQDLKLQRGRVEVEWFNGEIVRLGREAGVPTPLNQALLERCTAMARDRVLPGAETVESIRSAARSLPVR